MKRCLNIDVSKILERDVEWLRKKGMEENELMRQPLSRHGSFDTPPHKTHVRVELTPDGECHSVGLDNGVIDTDGEGENIEEAWELALEHLSSKVRSGLDLILALTVSKS